MTLEEFKDLALTYNVIPLSKSMLADTLTPVSAYLRLREGSTSSFLFESVEGGERFARYSFIGRNPLTLIKCRDKTTTLFENGRVRTSDKNLFDILQSITSKYKQPSLPGLPRFTGGLVGVLGYDSIRFIEDIPSGAQNDSLFEDSIFGLFTTIVIFDHLKHQAIIVVNVCIENGKDPASQYNEAMAEIESLETLLLSSNARTSRFRLEEPFIEPCVSREEFQSLVVKAKRYITEGDIFQVVLSHRLTGRYHGDPFNVYRALRVLNPSPYLYFLDFEGEEIIGSSPEVLVRVEDRRAEIYPIAGTRPRGKCDEEDRRLEAQLLSDEKERAEHIMLVDLGRNDLGRVCEIGTVRVEQLMAVVRYSHVMHIASRVVGRVMSNKSSIDVLKAAFPAGTVSGAPKIRAMEIIDELEGMRRGFYAGGVGYFDFSGNMDMCIAIRTMFAKNGIVHIQAGAGIVADSDPRLEYEETMNKAKAMIDALHMAAGVTH